MEEKQKIKVMVNGLNPDANLGKMSREIARAIKASEDFNLVPYSLTGAGVVESNGGPVMALNESRTQSVYLISPEKREEDIVSIKKLRGDFISVDYTHPSAVNDNADFYYRHKLPFVMGTTGGDRAALEERVKNSEICAVIAPNMAAPIVSLMDFMDKYSREYEGTMRDCCDLEIIESHQQGKADTSGTAKAMVKYFNLLGIPFDVKDIKMIRTPAAQRILGVPEEHLKGHGWHFYHVKANSKMGDMANALLSEYLTAKLFVEENPALKEYKFDRESYGVDATSPDGAVFLRTVTNPAKHDLSITHNINGRSVYVDGTLQAVRFLDKKIQEGEKGKVYSMIDVLRQ